MRTYIFFFFLIVLINIYRCKINICSPFYLHYPYDLFSGVKVSLFPKWTPQSTSNRHYSRLLIGDNGNIQRTYMKVKAKENAKAEKKHLMNPITYLPHWNCGRLIKKSFSLKEHARETEAIKEKGNKKKVKLIANWKCYLQKKKAYELIDILTKLDISSRVDLILSPNLLYIPYLQKKIEENKSPIKICCQDISGINGYGPFTGETTACMYSDFLVTEKEKYVLIGHSEKKKNYFQNPETDEQTATKLRNALNANLVPVLCFGHDFSNRTCKFSFSKIKELFSLIKEKITYAQWKKVIFAFEPHFAVGTGLAASYEIINECCSFIKQWLAKEIDQETSDSSSIIYGGSVGTSNIEKFLHNSTVDGFLIGKASVSENFIHIIRLLANTY